MTFHMKGVSTFIAFAVSVCFFFLIHSLLASNLGSISAITVDAWSDHDDVMFFYFDNSADGPSFNEKKISNLGKLLKNEQVTFTVSMRNNGVKWLRMDPGNSTGIIKIYSMVIHPGSKKKVVLDAAQIYNMFDAGKHGVEVTLGDGYVEIIAQVEDPYLIAGNLPSSENVVGLFSIPVFLISFYLFILLNNLQWDTVGNYFLIGRELPQGSELIQPLDGLRGVAAIWVVAEHCWGRFAGAGFSGVMVFFALSGFLLARPFVLNPEKLYKSGFLLAYGMRRLQRILPMYYLNIFLVYGVTKRWGEALLHAFFIKGNGHLWAIPQEMLFYLIFPFIIFVNGVVFRNRLLPILVSLIVAIYCWATMVDTQIIYLWGAFNRPIPFRLSSFLIGVLFSYLYYGFIFKKQTFCHRIEVRYIFAVVGTLILFGFSFLSSGQVFDFSNQLYTKLNPNLTSILAGLLIVLILCSPKTFFTKFLSTSILCSLGTVSYSLYLLHPMVMVSANSISRKLYGVVLEDYVLFLITLAATYLISCVTYRVIERPFLRLQ